MFAVINDGTTVGLCDAPRYVKTVDGIYVESSINEADHVAIGGVAYDLDETVVKELDSGEVAFGHGVKISEMDVDVSDTQDAICILSEDIEARLADMEDAICEMSKEV